MNRHETTGERYEQASCYLAVLLLAACTARSAMGPGGTAQGTSAFATNGERIYFTSTSERGGRIIYSNGPDMEGIMMGGVLTCASCHGPTGQGGQHIMQVRVMDAPDIRWRAVTGEADEGGEGEEEHAEHAAEYDLDTFRLAVVEGKHPDGKPLKADMPRWRMSDADLSDSLQH